MSSKTNRVGVAVALQAGRSRVRFPMPHSCPGDRLNLY